jgi:integrase
MATVFIQRRKRKGRYSYVVFYKDPGTRKNKYYKTYSRSKDARQAANDLRTLIDSGGIAKVERRKLRLNPLTFSEVSEYQKADWKNKLEAKKLSQKTYDEYVIALAVVNRAYGSHLLCEMTRDDILTYQSEVAAALTAVTANRRLFIIKQVFKKGLEKKAIPEDVSKGISYLSEKQHERNKFLLPAAVVSLVEASQRTKAKYYMPALIYLGAEHGTARQEALCLEWRDIDFEFEGQGIIRFFRTKNGKERTEYLMPRTREALLTWRSHQERARRRLRLSSIKSDRVFCRHDGMPIKRFDAAWNSTCRIAGIEDFHYHDLRHTYCSNLLLSGSDLKDVKEMIGHSDLSMTDRYSHLTLRRKRMRQERLAEYYASITPES